MLSKLSTKIALKKAGLGDLSLPSNFSLPSFPSSYTTSNNTTTSNSRSNSSKPSNATSTSQSSYSNPFSSLTLTLPKSLSSWQTPTPPPIPIAPSPLLGKRAPISSEKLRMPSPDGRPTIILFLRHVGCPFAEQTLLSLHKSSSQHPRIRFLAISHASPPATSAWLSRLNIPYPPTSSGVQILVDEERILYAQWGLGVSNTWHLMNPRTLQSLYKTGSGKGGAGEEGEGMGNRWQVGGCWGVDGRGVVRWGGMAGRADEGWDVGEGVRRLGG
ncbi:MAG: hypothetical protein Q9227_006683 [Pyrenula ochraceoflavens]